MQGRLSVVLGRPGVCNTHPLLRSVREGRHLLIPWEGHTHNISSTDSVSCCPFCWLFDVAQGTSELLQGANNNNRRLLELPSAHARGLHSARHLHAASPPAKAAAAPPAPAASAARREAGAPIPVIANSDAVVENVPPTVSPLMSMQDMLCTVQEYSPTRLQGMLLPDRKNTTAAGIPIKCGAPPQPTIFRYQQLVFKPVKIPVVFHCELSAGVSVSWCKASALSAAKLSGS